MQPNTDKRWLRPMILITVVTLAIYAAFLISDFYHRQHTDTYQITVDQQNDTPMPNEEESTPAAESPSPANGIFVASKVGEKYHTKDCEYAGKIKDENLITFATAEEAVANGYEPCGVCHPDS